MTTVMHAAATALALAVSLSAAPAIAQTAEPPPGLPNVPTTKVIAIGSVTEKWTPDAIRTVMPDEVQETVRLYLAGKIDQWFVRRDRPGVVFIFNVSDPHEAEKLLGYLPLGRSGLMTFEIIPLGPLAPLGLLSNEQSRTAKPN